MQPSEKLLDEYKRIRQGHLDAGFVDYNVNNHNLLNCLQTHFYKCNIMEALHHYLTTPDAVVFGRMRGPWFNDIDWEKIYTDKWVYCDKDDPGAISFAGTYVKDQYFDYANALIPYYKSGEDVTLLVYDAFRNWHLSKGIYKEKPQVIVYMVGIIINKYNPEEVAYWFNELTKNIGKFKKLE